MRICYLDISASYSHSSLALPMLHMACKGVVEAEWSVIRGTIKDDVHALAAQIVEASPDVVLSTLYLFTHVPVMRTLRRVHAMLPQAGIFLGGPEFLGHNEAFLRREPCVKAVCRGEGEEALPALLQSLKEESRWCEWVGLCWLDRDQAYRDNGSAALDEATWNAQPPPSESVFFDWSKPFIQIETNRGCAQFCTFCTSYRTGPTRWEPMDRLRQVLSNARDHGVQEIRILDRTFNATPRHAIDRLRLFANEYSDLRFHLEIHPAFLPQHFRDALEEMPEGLLHLEVGIQTTHPEALVAAGRAGTPEVNWDGFAFLCSLKNVDIHADLIGGLPRLGFKHQLKDLKDLTLMRPADIQLEILKVLPGTPVAQQAEGYGLKYAPDPPYEVLETPEMSASEVQKTVQLSRIVDRYYNQPTLKPAVILAVGSEADFYGSFLEYVASQTDPTPPMSLKRRANYLYRYLSPRDPEAADLVAIHWLLEGMPANIGPGDPDRWKDQIPDSGKLIKGSDARSPKGHVWRLNCRSSEMWFVYDRAVDHRPVAVYQSTGVNQLVSAS